MTTRSSLPTTAGRKALGSGYIFDPFYSGKGDVGKGLGLYIARAERPSERLSVELSGTGDPRNLPGATFVVDFEELREMNHLVGPVAFIDDELDNTASEAFQLLEEIRATGRPVATGRSIPADPEDWFAHWQGLAFAVIDWDLTPSAHGTVGSWGQLAVPP